jgi:hypothetical protein
VSAWPSIQEPELLERLRLGPEQFGEYIRRFAASLPPRALDAALLNRAYGYPWERPPGAYLLDGEVVEPLAAIAPERRRRVVAELTDPGNGRAPLLAIGSNAAPLVLAQKFAHFEVEADRRVLALSGRLHDFDVGASAHPALYGSLPATLFPSPGCAVATTLLWLTQAQFTQLAWSEISYRLGCLRTRFEADGDVPDLDAVLVFVSRFGAFRVEGEPVAMAAVPAAGRSAIALSQEELLDAAAALALGGGADAESLVRAVFADLGGLIPQLARTLHREALPFESERWTPFPGPSALRL